jgi:hypothetical protein
LLQWLLPRYVDGHGDRRHLRYGYQLILLMKNPAFDFSHGQSHAPEQIMNARFSRFNAGHSLSDIFDLLVIVAVVVLSFVKIAQF